MLIGAACEPGVAGGVGCSAGRGPFQPEQALFGSGAGLLLLLGMALSSTLAARRRRR
jgi:hypothetical protein